MCYPQEAFLFISVQNLFEVKRHIHMEILVSRQRWGSQELVVSNVGDNSAALLLVRPVLALQNTVTSAIASYMYYLLSYIYYLFTTLILNLVTFCQSQHSFHRCM